MKLLVTRPAADSAALAALLEAQGHEVLIDPMLEIRPNAAEPPSLDGVNGVLFTSANGVRAFAALCERRDVAVYVVGDRTAEAARIAGFSQIESADGDVEALAVLAAARCKPEDGALLHVSGTVQAGNLAETLGAQGFTVRHVALYDAISTTELAPPTRTAIENGTLDGVLLFSPRTARHFAELIAAAGLGERARRLQAWCLSRAVADALAPLRLVGIHIAAEPTQASLLRIIGVRKDAAAGSGFALGSAGAARPVAASVPRRGRSWAGVAALLLLAAGAAATAPQWLSLVEPMWQRAPERPSPPPAVPTPAPTIERSAEPVAPVPAEPASAEPDATPDALTQRLDRLEAALDGIRVETASAAPKGSVTALQTQMAELGPKLDMLATRPATDPQVVQDLTAETRRLAAALAQLSDRLTPIEARVNQKATAIRDDRTLVLAAGQIRDALAGSGPFDAPVAVIRAVAPEDADLAGPLAVLESHAKTGVPGRARLMAELADLPAKLARPAPLAADAGLWDRVTDKMGRLVTVRRVDDGAGADGPPTPDHLVANAQRVLAAGDLAGAVQILHALDGAQAGAVKSWLDDAQARLACEQAALALETAAVRRLATPAAGAAE
ncbi:MAG: hypothetical protein QOJ54_2514 [Aliidongia sp.]|nr:hypothetical protein [Aliidongia sp.]